MRKNLLLFCFPVMVCGLMMSVGCAKSDETAADPVSIALPAPHLNGTMSVEKALDHRRSVRSYANAPLTLGQVSQLLWAAQGITDPKTGHRTAPSAVAVYPLTVYLVAGRVEGLAPGVYRYIPKGHSIVKVLDGDRRQDLVADSGQQTPGKAPISLVIAGDYGKMQAKVGTRMPGTSARLVDLEVGHAAENVCLQATALGLGTVTMGGIDESKVQKSLSIPASQTPVYIMPVGKLP